MKSVRHITAAAHFSGQRAAIEAVSKAVAAGHIPKACEWDCIDCKAQAEVYDHRDYNKPLDVDPVCRSCNAKRGAAKALSNPEPAIVERTAMPDELPATVALHLLAECESYRAAVRMAWELRRSRGMTRATLAEMIGAYPAHVTDYLSESEKTPAGNERRELLARLIPAFERAVGNTYVSQWLAYKSGLTVLQGLIAEQKAA
jgi:hypothetical protein